MVSALYPECFLARRVVGIDGVQIEHLNTPTTGHRVLAKKWSTILS